MALINLDMSEAVGDSAASANGAGLRNAAKGRSYAPAISGGTSAAAASAPAASAPAEAPVKPSLLRGQTGPLPKDKIDVEIDGIHYEVDPAQPFGKRGPVTLVTEHRLIMMMLLSEIPRDEIARRMNRSLQNINLIIRSPMFASELRKYEQQMFDKVTDVTARFRAGAPEAHNALMDMVKAEGAPKHSPVRLGAATAYLKYAGAEPVKKTEHKEVIEKRHVISVQEAWRKRRELIAGPIETGATLEAPDSGDQPQLAESPAASSISNDSADVTAPLSAEAKSNEVEVLPATPRFADDDEELREYIKDEASYDDTASPSSEEEKWTPDSFVSSGSENSSGAGNGAGSGYPELDRALLGAAGCRSKGLAAPVEGVFSDDELTNDEALDDAEASFEQGMRRAS